MSLTTVDLRRLNLRPGERLLDLGCGEGRHAIDAAIDYQLQVIGVDLSAHDLLTARERAAAFDLRGQLQPLVASALHLPFPDGCFDHVICSEVLEHILDYRQVLAEVSRVLRPGGSLTVSVPRYTPERICWQLSAAYYRTEGGHLRIFQAGALRAAVESHGYRFVQRHWVHALHVPYWWLSCALGEQAWLTRLWHRLLVWDLLHAPPLTRAAEALLNPIMGKSVVLYFVREARQPRQGAVPGHPAMTPS